MVELRELENQYSKNYHEVFEDLATLMFCTELNWTRGVNRRIDQEGLESDPICIGDRKYAYQAKYYKASTALKDRKNELKESISVARSIGVTDLYFFINKNKPDKNSNTGEEVSYIKEIEEEAKGKNEEKSITLEWWTLSRIESALSTESSKFYYLRDVFFKKNSETRIVEFYQDINKRLEKRPKNKKYDRVSLQESYIELYVMKREQSVHEFLEEFVAGEEYIAVISGEPGQGKTSLCYKAMIDFYNGWLLGGKVLNVFCFSLNPGGLPVYKDGYFDLYPLLSWGHDRKSHTFKDSDCKNALVFFDGLDELIEKYPGLTYSGFFESIKDFQDDTDSHIIITSRNMAVVNAEECDSVLDDLDIHTYSVQYISKEQQENWISLLKDYLTLKTPEKADEVREYLDQYQNLDVEDDIKNILGIPRIFRMVVDGLMLPQKGQPVTDFFNKLFDVNWVRRKRSDNLSKEEIKRKLQDYALNIFLSNNETAEINISNDRPWVFSYYMKNYGQKKVGFLNKSFYRYFLAGKIFSWFERYSNGNDTDDEREEFQTGLSNLVRRKLDLKTIEFIKELFEQHSDGRDKEKLEKSFCKAYEILKTIPVDIAPVLRNLERKEGDETLSIEEATNILYNIISIGSACGQNVTVGNTDVASLRFYNLSGCILDNAVLRGNDVDLRGAVMKAASLRKVDFSNARLRGADFSRADLSGATFTDTDLRGAIFGIDDDAEEDVGDFSIDRNDTNCCGANFHGAQLQGADFSGANLSNADFREADLRGVNFSGAFLKGTKISKGALSGECLKDEVFENVEWS